MEQEKSENKKEKLLQKINKLANQYASQSIEKALDQIEDVLWIEDAPKWDKERARRVVGELIAMGYALGYADRHQQLKSLKN